MAGQKSERKQFPVKLGGPLTEIVATAKLAGGIKSGRNFMYRPIGAVTNSPGNDPAFYSSAIDGNFSNAPTSGIRWYCGLPTLLTQTVLSARGAMYVGGDSGALTKVFDYTSANSEPIGFTSAFDPALAAGVGGDVLIMTGITAANGFATLPISIGTVNNAGDVITITWGGTGAGTAAYTVLPTDNAASIVAALVSAINVSTAVTPGAPFLAHALPSTTVSPNGINVWALLSGAAGNAITGRIGSTGGGFNGTPAAATNFTGGGASFTGPLKWDGTTVSGLSGAISQPFKGCVSWHNHVWFWGDAANPGTLYATDINQPEGWSFMTANGGYAIGKGDGDPVIRDCVPVGNILYVFKTNSIYAITGYDFQAGEYQFNVQPAIKNVGVSNRGAVAVLRNALVFWTGSTFRRLATGAFDTEPISTPIPITTGGIAGLLNLQAVAGSFFMYGNSGTSAQPQILSNVALFVDINGNVLYTYDDDASQAIGNYAWAQWTNENLISCWIPFTGGRNSAGTAIDLPLLLGFSSVGTNPVNLDKMFALSNVASTRQTTITTGWITCDTPALTKELHEIFFEVVVNGKTAPPATGALMTVEIDASVYNEQSNNGVVYPPATYTLPDTPMPNSTRDKYFLLKVTLKPFLRANAFQFTITINGVSGMPTQVQLGSMVLDYVEEAFMP